MKKYIYGLLLLGVLASCRKSEYEPKLGNPDERLSEQEAAYMKQLASAEFGWKAFLATQGKEVYTFALKFNDKNRVTMSGDVNAASMVPAESSFRLKSLQRPTLLFDTYSYLHILQDPTPSVSGGVAGEGRYSDFEFIVLSASTDTIKLEGTFNKSKLLLIRSKSQVETDQILPSVVSVTNKINNIRTYFKRLTFNSVEYEVNIDAASKNFAITRYTAGVGETKSSLYYVDGPDMVFLDPIVLGDATLRGLSGITYDQSNNAVSATSEGKPVVIKEAVAPMLYDKTAATRFASFVGQQWGSIAGFTKDGVQDYLDIRSIPGYAFIIMWANTNALGVPNRDVIGFVRANIDYYGGFTLPKPELNNGIMKYVQMGNTAGINNAPYNVAPNNAKAAATMANFKLPDGFYVIQPREGVYDFVSVADARIWIQFE